MDTLLDSPEFQIHSDLAKRIKCILEQADSLPIKSLNEVAALDFQRNDSKEMENAISQLSKKQTEKYKQLN